MPDDQQYMPPPFPVEVPPQTFPDQPASSFTEEEEAVPTSYYIFGWLILLIVLGGIGVGIWWFFFREASVEDLPPSTDTTDTTETGEGADDNPETGLIDDEGGVVVSDDGARVIVPAGAVDEPVKIEIEKIESGRVTDLYHLKPDGFEFKKTVTVEIPYKEASLYEGEMPEDIFLLYRYKRFDESSKVNTTLNTTKKIVSTKVSRF